ncbi:5553_t:CDS:2, partial [Acaulospora colombiana]
TCMAGPCAGAGMASGGVSRVYLRVHLQVFSVVTEAQICGVMHWNRFATNIAICFYSIPAGTCNTGCGSPAGAPVRCPDIGQRVEVWLKSDTQWNDLLLRPCSTIQPIYELFQHLIDIPRHAHLVKTIILDCFDDLEYYNEAEREAVDKIDVHTFAKEIQNRGLPPILVSKVVERVHWAVALSLLSLLPNLEGAPLRWIDMWGDTRQGIPLDAESLFPAFSYPSLIEIAACRVAPRSRKDDNDVKIFSQADVTRRYNESDVKAVELLDSYIDSDTLARFLRLPRALKKFVYIESDDCFTLTSRSEVDFRRALDYISGTVEILVLELNNDAILRAGTWSLSYFKCIRTLSISYKLLVAEDRKSVVDRLPPLLEVLFLRILRRHALEDESIIDCFETILMRKSQDVLAHLEVISQSNPGCDWSRLKDLAAEKGVKIGPYDLIPDRYIRY